MAGLKEEFFFMLGIFDHNYCLKNIVIGLGVLKERDEFLSRCNARVIFLVLSNENLIMHMEVSSFKYFFGEPTNVVLIMHTCMMML
jgi:hypothetical protein